MSANLATHVRRAEWAEVMRAVAAHPQLVQRKDSKSRQYVLFMAIDNHAPPELLLQLLKAFPAAVKTAEADDFGRRCVHLALEKRCNRSVTLTIISTHPVDMQVHDRQFRKPLHYLRNFNFEVEFVGAFLPLRFADRVRPRRVRCVLPARTRGTRVCAASTPVLRVGWSSDLVRVSPGLTPHARFCLL
jgi:hypothetical protein